MTRHALVGRHVKVSLWEDLAHLLPGGPRGLITHVAGDGDDAELIVQLPGFRMTFCFLLGEVVLLPVEHIEAALYTASNPTQQGDTVHLYPTSSAAQLEHGNGQPIYRVAAFLARDGLRLLPHGSFAPDFDSAWTTPAELHADGSVSAEGPLPGWLFV